MGSVPEKRRLRHSYVLVLVLVLVFAAWLRSPDLVPWIVSFSGHDAQGEPLALVDRFTAIGCLFSGFAFVGLVYSVILQRKDLDRSIEEMRKSADAQTAQVKLGALSALLASLPVLIREEENRLVSTASRLGYDQYPRERLEALPPAALVLEASDMREQLDATIQAIANLEGELKVASRATQTSGPEDRATHRANEMELGLRIRELKMQRNREKMLVESLERLVTLRQELAATYEQMKAYQNWKVADSDTSVSTGPEGDGSQG
ncbi:MAG: hypothetical protein RBU25_04740 [Lentisphaeria bacterium]|jgi:hypothetical protein|nr:hypothetical protein [Lentisphaeria bacterium]